MSPITYREAKTSDIRALARIRAAEWETEQYWVKRIAAYLDGELDPRFALKPRACYIAHDGKSALGFIAGHLTRRHSCDGEMEWINVIPERRRNGIASELLRLLAAWFITKNAKRICVDVHPSNAARIFYKNHGARDLKLHWMVWSDIRLVLAKFRR